MKIQGIGVGVAAPVVVDPGDDHVVQRLRELRPVASISRRRYRRAPTASAAKSTGLHGCPTAFAATSGASLLLHGIDQRPCYRLDLGLLPAGPLGEEAEAAHRDVKMVAAGRLRR